MKQATLKREVLLKGRGLHAGMESEIVLKPAAEDSGLTVSLSGKKNGGSFTMSPFCVCDTKRGTTLKLGGFKLHTVEHLVSAIRGLGITNAEICVIKGNEPPIYDGSALYFCREILKAGIARQKKEMRKLEIKNPVLVKDKDAYIAAIPCDIYRISYYSDFSQKGLVPMHADFDEKTDYEKKLAPARTFGFKKEIEWLLNSGLIKGADMGSAVLFNEKGEPENTKLRFKTEPAMHKVLDITGDLGLINAGIKAHIIAYRTGHRHNIELAKKLLQ